MKIIKKMNTKKLLVTTCLASTLLVCASSYANSTSTPDIFTALQQAIAFYQKEAYQDDSNITNNATVNPENQAGKYIAAQNSFNATQSNIVDSLQSMPMSILSTNDNAKNAFYIKTMLQLEQNVKYNLTVNTPASDTLYYNGPYIALARYMPGLGGADLSKPSTLHDNYFNVGSVLAPVSYTPDQLTAADNYATYLSYSYNFPTDGIKMDELKSKLGDLNTPMGWKKQYEMLHKLQINPAYQDYQLAVRSNMAASSVLKSNLNYLINERTPIKQLGNTPGVTAVDGKASPLQVEHYAATHRVNDPNWYKHIRTLSPASVQRETLMVLAEIENQNYQAHLDRERILATMSAQQAQAISSGQILLKTKAQEVNSVIDNLSSNSGSSQSDDSDSNGKNSDSADKERQKAEAKAKEIANGPPKG
ncbi:MAG: hypothetical protein K0U29_08145 [Gammaproteobacteria bacterium]|nr:hypothetical protein [Gammaproteobacteria bacterium]MCH9744881.1 hypothetical protein [Gammaproteobacteria bacterium]